MIQLLFVKVHRFIWFDPGSAGILPAPKLENLIHGLRAYEMFEWEWAGILL